MTSHHHARWRWSLLTTICALILYGVFVSPATPLTFTLWPGFNLNTGIGIRHWGLLWGISRWWDILLVGLLTALTVVIIQTFWREIGKKERWPLLISWLLCLIIGLWFGWIQAIAQAIILVIIALTRIWPIIPLLASMIIIFFFLWAVISALKYIFRPLRAFFLWLCAMEKGKKFTVEED